MEPEVQDIFLVNYPVDHYVVKPRYGPGTTLTFLNSQFCHICSTGLVTRTAGHSSISSQWHKHTTVLAPKRTMRHRLLTKSLTSLGKWQPANTSAIETAMVSPEHSTDHQSQGMRTNVVEVLVIRIKRRTLLNRRPMLQIKSATG